MVATSRHQPMSNLCQQKRGTRSSSSSPAVLPLHAVKPGSRLAKEQMHPGQWRCERAEHRQSTGRQSTARPAESQASSSPSMRAKSVSVAVSGVASTRRELKMLSDLFSMAPMLRQGQGGGYGWEGLMGVQGGRLIASLPAVAVRAALLTGAALSKTGQARIAATEQSPARPG